MGKLCPSFCSPDNIWGSMLVIHIEADTTITKVKLNISLSDLHPHYQKARQKYCKAAKETKTTRSH